MDALVVGFILFHPDFDVLNQTLNYFKQKVKYIVLYDNGMNQKTKKKFMASNYILIGDGSNKGVAAALNAIMDYADKRFNAEWVFVSDQDSSFSDNIIDEYTKLFNDDSIGAICPEVIKNSGNLELDIPNVSYRNVKRCPTSGMAMRVSDWKKIGKYNEKLFIDYVDYDICEKLLINKKRIVRIKNTFLIQRLGNAKNNSLILFIGNVLNSDRIKKSALLFNHSPKRNYFFVRNGIFYIRTYHQYISVKKEIYFMVKWELKKIIFERYRIRQLRAIFHGITDGLRNSI